MATIKKASKGTFSPKSSNVSKRLGSYGKKMKSGGSFPDLNKDGKVTKKDVLIGRGVLPKTAKKGKMVKKAQDGKMQPIKKEKSGRAPLYENQIRYQLKQDKMRMEKERKEKEAMLPKGLKVGRKGLKMTKKCRYGCK